MTTPAHVILSLTALGRRRRPDLAPAIVAGAVLPDLPIVAFYAWQRLGRGASEAAIWGALYFRTDWQLFFDCFNSIPLAAAGGIVAWARGMPRAAAFCASLVLHALADLPLHHDDGHRHFLPLSAWRFESPVSYWDPRHHGAVAAALETALVAGGSVVLWRRHQHAGARLAFAAVCAVSVAAYVVFYV